MPNRTATAWKGVTYRTMAVTKQKVTNIAVALSNRQQGEIKYVSQTDENKVGILAMTR
jgi:hypothetical protein